MSTHKWIDRICVAAVVLSLLLTMLFINGEALGIQPADKVIGYENRLFDTSRVHTIDVVMDDWDGFLSTCQSEEYSACSVVIDGESYKNVAIRAKGNTSLSSVSAMGSSRYSFKIEFDHYDNTKSYHGLDKLSLNNLIQDNTMMKDYLTYQMMNAFGVAGSLCSFVYITVNGEDWGLYLAVEGVEEAFLRRNYGSDYGELYKPDSMSFGGGRGNGRDFNINDFAIPSDGEDTDTSDRSNQSGQFGQMPGPGGFDPSSVPGGGDWPEDTGDSSFGGQGMMQPPSNTPPDGADLDGFDPSAMFGGGGFGGMGGFSFGSSSDVKLQYIDDDPESYSNIFDSVKTDISDGDRARLITSLRSLSAYEDLENVLDTDAVLRYFVVHNFVVNGDSYTGSMIHNYYLYEEEGRLSMIPWDYNLAFGTFQGQDASGAVNDAIDDVLSDRPMQAWIFSDETYTRRYHELYTEFLNTVDAARIIEEAYGLIADYVEKDPTKFCTYEEFENGVQTLKTFCSLRKESVQGQLDGTIASTSEGQNADPASRINADGLNLSDMGTMNNGGGMGGGPGGFDRSSAQNGQGRPEGSARPSGSGPAADGKSDVLPEQQPDSMPAGQENLSESRQPPGMGSGNAFPPSGDQAASGAWQSAALSLGISALVLALGLVVAFKFKR